MPLLCVFLFPLGGRCCRHYCCCARYSLLGYRPPLRPPPPLLLCIDAAGAAPTLFSACLKMCTVFVVLIHAVRGFFTTVTFLILRPIRLIACHRWVDSQMSLRMCGVFSIVYRLLLCFMHNRAPCSLQS